MWVILSILGMVICYFVLYLIFLIIEPLFTLLPQSTLETVFAIGFISIIIATNIRWYRSAYVKGKGKKWHFWISVVTLIMFVIVFISMVTQ